MKMINKMGLAASLILASSLASANVYNIGDHTNISSDRDVNPGVAGAFTDEFNFSLTEANFFTAFASSTVGSISEFTSFSVSGDNGSVWDLGYIVAGVYPATNIGDPIGSTLLSMGNYTLKVEGIATSTTSGYTLNMVTSPVPEPSSIALMLGGLGLVGFMAARRKKA